MSKFFTVFLFFLILSGVIFGNHVLGANTPIKLDATGKTIVFDNSNKSAIANYLENNNTQYDVTFMGTWDSVVTIKNWTNTGKITFKDNILLNLSKITVNQTDVLFSGNINVNITESNFLGRTDIMGESNSKLEFKNTVFSYINIEKIGEKLLFDNVETQKQRINLGYGETGKIFINNSIIDEFEGQPYGANINVSLCNTVINKAKIKLFLHQQTLMKNYTITPDYMGVSFSLVNSQIKTAYYDILTNSDYSNISICGNPNIFYKINIHSNDSGNITLSNVNIYETSTITNFEFFHATSLSIVETEETTTYSNKDLLKITNTNSLLKNINVSFNSIEPSISFYNSSANVFDLQGSNNTNLNFYEAILHLNNSVLNQVNLYSIDEDLKDNWSPNTQKNQVYLNDSQITTLNLYHAINVHIYQSSIQKIINFGVAYNTDSLWAGYAYYTHVAYGRIYLNSTLLTETGMRLFVSKHNALTVLDVSVDEIKATNSTLNVTNSNIDLLILESNNNLTIINSILNDFTLENNNTIKIQSTNLPGTYSLTGVNNTFDLINCVFEGAVTFSYSNVTILNSTFNNQLNHQNVYNENANIFINITDSMLAGFNFALADESNNYYYTFKNTIINLFSRSYDSTYDKVHLISENSTFLKNNKIDWNNFVNPVLKNNILGPTSEYFYAMYTYYTDKTEIYFQEITDTGFGTPQNTYRVERRVNGTSNEKQWTFLGSTSTKITKDGHSYMVFVDRNITKGNVYEYRFLREYRTPEGDSNYFYAKSITDLEAATPYILVITNYPKTVNITSTTSLPVSVVISYNLMNPLYPDHAVGVSNYVLQYSINFENGSQYLNPTNTTELGAFSIELNYVATYVITMRFVDGHVRIWTDPVSITITVNKLNETTNTTTAKTSTTTPTNNESSFLPGLQIFLVLVSIIIVATIKKHIK